MAPPNDQGQKHLPRISAPDAEFATILVGPSKTKWTIYQELLTYHSPFFKAALTGRFREAEQKTVTLEDVSPTTFEFFVHWLQNGRFPNEKDCPDLRKIWDDNCCTQASCSDTNKTENLAKLYVFCDKYQVLHLKDILMQEIFGHVRSDYHGLPSFEVVNIAFDSLPHEDPLRRYLVDAYVNWGWDEIWADSLNELPLEFTEEVLRLYARVIKERQTKTGQRILIIMSNNRIQEKKIMKKKKVCPRRYEKSHEALALGHSHGLELSSELSSICSLTGA